MKGMNGFADPAKNINEFLISEGMKVADFGAGTGQYTMAAAKRVGENGKVYCIDVQQGLLQRVEDEAAKQGLHNIEYIWADLEGDNGSKLSNACVDAVIVSNILFQVENKEKFVQETARVLRPAGRVLVVDWSDSFGGLGPTPAHIVRKEDIRSLYENAGFIYDKEISAGDHHWGIVLRKR